MEATAGPGVGRGAWPGTVFDTRRQFLPQKSAARVRTRGADVTGTGPEVVTTYPRSRVC
jgi:hypothetical protein